MDGQPFFVVSQAVDPGLLQVLEQEIIPRLEFHLATALLWKEMSGVALVMATHDGALALGAQAYGLPVVGVPPA